MRGHPPEVMLYVTPLAIICGVSITMAFSSGSIIAWCIATVTGVICMAIPVVVHFYCLLADRIQEETEEIDSDEM
jgi:hypothetical protein